MLIDTHCHLNHERFDGEADEALARAREAGVSACIVIGYDLPSSERAVELAAESPEVFAAVGVHPHDASTLDAPALERIRELSRQPKVVAIGEIGLDFYRDLSPRDEQARAFRQQLALAAEVRRQGIRVIVVSPGAVDTPLWDKAGGDLDRARMLTAEDVAETIYGALAFSTTAVVDELVVMPRDGFL